ncbi:hemerythrin [Micractinium conductrix]|uniref:Hemerythrin n=1 Tax=Micractinium conductrix TaxID=554055 RepID=A0A2P6VAG7_9CHLO|nr:hemerythrin [Micractinium conductrix]|eukprot:PSC71089.1 hemerythrin [Micractinium conductrix]
MAPKASPAKASPAKKEKEEEKAASPAKASPAKASPASGKARAASPSKQTEKSPAKKAKASPEAAVAAAEGPAAHTRTKEGTLPAATAGKATANAAAVGGLPQMTITDVLLGDHRDTVALLKHFEDISASGDKLAMEKLTDAIAIVVRLHSQAEMEVLYPLMEKLVGSKEGEEARKHAAAEHARIERDLLKALEQRKTGSDELAATMKDVLDAFVAHLKEEEEELVPKMLNNMSDEEQIDLAQSFLAAKATAPLEPQPEAAEAMA